MSSPSSFPLIPDTAPFTLEQRAWLNGFFAGLFSRGPAPATVGGELARATPALQPLTILFGSQTGTAEGLAKKAAKEAGQRGFAATVMDMAPYSAPQLAAEKNVLVITSTYGDGEPPDNAKALHAALKSEISPLKSEPPPPLAAVRYSVCALGDTNYTQFCQCGKDFDATLEKLGATRVAPRVDCDLDYEEKFRAWLDAALTALAEVAPASSRPSPTADAPASAAESRSKIKNRKLKIESGFSRSRPFPAPVLTVRCLNAPGSAKEINHVELSLEDSGLAYEVGDALGVLPQNCPELVADVLTALGCDGEEAVPTPDGGATSLRRALTELYHLGKPTPELLALLTPVGASLLATNGASVATEVAPTEDAIWDVLDLLLAQPGAKPAPADFVRALRKLQPRLYSIASSPQAHPGQVHLTVGAVRYEANGRLRKGVCSTFLAERAVPAQSRVGVFVRTNKAFRLPPSGDTPIIMVGPGTGLAPFRAFLEARRATGAKGRNWLFFGDRRESADFLYRDEILGFRRDGHLTRLDLAWSRDQTEKVYVQHRMREHACDLWAWIEAGAHFYVCGDASRMAKDVHTALHQVIQRAGGRTPAQTADYVKQLQAAKRYARDVY